MLLDNFIIAFEERNRKEAANTENAGAIGPGVTDLKSYYTLNAPKIQV